MNILANPIHLANLERSYLWLAKNLNYFTLIVNTPHPTPPDTHLLPSISNPKSFEKNSDFLKSVVQMTVPLC